MLFRVVDANIFAKKLSPDIGGSFLVLERLYFHPVLELFKGQKC